MTAMQSCDNPPPPPPHPPAKVIDSSTWPEVNTKCTVNIFLSQSACVGNTSDAVNMLLLSITCQNREDPVPGIRAKIGADKKTEVGVIFLPKHLFRHLANSNLRSVITGLHCTLCLQGSVKISLVVWQTHKILHVLWGRSVMKKSKIK